MTWNAVWKDKMRKYLESKDLTEDDIYWNSEKRAREYDLHVSSNNWARGRKAIEGLGISPGDYVLDIGSGTGALAIPLAQAGAKVTALDSSHYMLDICRKHAKELGLSSINYVHKRWESVDVENDFPNKFNFVIASFSLGMTDIKDALEKMRSVCSGTIILFWFAAVTEYEKAYLQIWPSLHGKKFVPSPKLDVLFNVLYDMGVYPNIEIKNQVRIESFESLDNMTSSVASRFGVKDEEQLAVLKRFLVRWTGPSAPYKMPSGFIATKLWWDEK